MNSPHYCFNSNALSFSSRVYTKYIMASNTRADKYQSMDHVSHVLHRPDTYVGSMVPTAREALLLDSNHVASVGQLEVADAFERIVLEILYNAADNMTVTLQSGVVPLPLEVDIDSRSIRITNYGREIPVEANEDGEWIPSVIFGRLLTSSNYNDDEIRYTGGRNGYGAKLTNIFSSRFEVSVYDPKSRSLFEQAWTNNMSNISPPDLTSLDEDPFDGQGRTSIYFEPELHRFGMDHIPQTYIDMLRATLALIAYSTGVEVAFTAHNKKEVLKTTSQKSLCAVVWPKQKTICAGSVEDGDARYEVTLIDLKSVAKPSAISLVNSVYTYDGGKHLDSVYRSLMKQLRIHILPTIDGGETIKLNRQMVSTCIGVLLKCELPNPSFTSQCKSKLSGPAVTIRVELRNKKLKGWRFIETIHDQLDADLRKQLKQSDGKKVRNTRLNKLEDANWAGTKRSQECSLFIIEGDNAANYTDTAIQYLPGGWDRYGYYPIRGKLLNVRSAKLDRVIANKEIQEIKKALGIREDVDYTQEKERKTLRYGHVIVAADADHDGKHIVGLVINMFACMYPSLVSCGFVQQLRTPILRVSRRGFARSFDTFAEYALWQQSESDWSKYTHAYLKGLASSTKADVKRDMKEASSDRIVTLAQDDSTSHELEKAFAPTQSNDRKKWILARLDLSPEERAHESIVRADPIRHIPISDYLNYELIEYCEYSLQRAIPSLLDGMKDAQRKALWVLMNNHKNGKPEVLKVSQYTGKVAHDTAYRHGDTSMSATIVKMAQGFVGANNIPYFAQVGQFGSRSSDTNPKGYRYLQTSYRRELNYIYRKEDLPLLKQMLRHEDGGVYEPTTLLPIVPMLLINGANGIASGFNTWVPQFSPYDIVDWLLARTSGAETHSIEVRPYYHGFTGALTLEPRKRNFNGRQVKVLTLESCGITEDDDNTITIREYPIDVMPSKVHSYIKTEMVDAGLVKDVHKKTIDRGNTDQLILTVYPTNSASSRCLNAIGNLLVRERALLSMRALVDGRPVRFQSQYKILESYYDLRLFYYEKRRQLQLSDLSKQIDEQQQRVQVIEAIVSQQLHIHERSDDDITDQASRLGMQFDVHAILNKLKLNSLTQVHANRIRTKLDELRHAHNELSETRAEDLWHGELQELKDALPSIMA